MKAIVSDIDKGKGIWNKIARIIASDKPIYSNLCGYYSKGNVLRKSLKI
jgi:hypothetical protein